MSHPLDALLAISSRSWPMLCASTKPSQHFTSTTTRLAMRESRPGGRRGGSLEDHRDHRDHLDLFQWFPVCSCDGFGTLSRHESRSSNKPSAAQRLIVADSLGISFGLCRFLRQQSSSLTGSCCRPRSQQDHQSRFFG